ncbi:restriction endonuclease subunit S [Proteiniphilum sp. UBA5480]|jgi:type I restriction enzyme S subunit|uniref:restriction endonuclease subunit S n=1 Tax=Proteiniphilum sp. UBA5480 TaxID=1947282 RepID=UPI002580BC22|nr:restriction endonuclease subunit S [Proteiniphilum sp. UBA5480]
MEEKNNIPQIRFKNFDENWEVKEFKEIFSNLPNNTLSRAELNYQTGLFKNVHYGDVLIKFGELLDVKNDRIPFISNDTLGNKFKLSKLQNGDIIIADTAEDETVGKCTELINAENENVVSGLHTIPVRPIQHFASKYLGYYLNSSSYHDQLLQLMQGIKVLSISKSALKSTVLVYPQEKFEQSKIGTYFQNLDKLITLQQQKHDKLVTLKKAMLDKMFPTEGADVPEIRFMGFTGDWDEEKLGDIGYTYTGLTGKTKADFGHGNGKYITYMNVFSNPVADNDITEAIEVDNNQNKVQFGDVFFTTSSETPEEVGMSSVWLKNCHNTYLNSFCFGYRPNIKVDNYYFAYLLRSTVIRKRIIFLAQGISRYNISKNKVMEISVPLPNLEEQKQIGSYFQNLDKLISLHQQEIQKLKNIKKACLEKMFV